VIFANAGAARFGALGHHPRVLRLAVLAKTSRVLFTVQGRRFADVARGGWDWCVIVLNAYVGGYKAVPPNGVYSATKAAVRSFGPHALG